jgi:predicted nucleic acid-binding protein
LTLYAPDTAILEFNAVLRSAYKEPRAIRNATLALRQALGLNGAKEASTLDTHLIARQCEIEEKHDLTYFDSLIAASALRLDQTVVSSDPSFDKVPGLARKALP